MKSVVRRLRLKCEVCGRLQVAEDIVRSDLTGRYCCVDIYKCQRRAKKAARVRD